EAKQRHDPRVGRGGRLDGGADGAVLRMARDDEARAPEPGGVAEGLEQLLDALVAAELAEAEEDEGVLGDAERAAHLVAAPPRRVDADVRAVRDDRHGRGRPSQLANGE